jgi:RNA polymerase sigma factor (TIGR02999 family)
MGPVDHAVTKLLKQWRAGDSNALNELTPLVYEQLRSLASRHMRGWGEGHTLRATAVVHEAYLRLVDAEIPFSDRVHFYAVAAQLMRRILLDWAKANRRLKRGGGAVKVSLDDVDPGGGDPEAILRINWALERFAALDAKRASLVEMVYFGGMTQTEAAAVLDVSVATVNRDLKFARAWLAKELNLNPEIE